MELDRMDTSARNTKEKAVLKEKIDSRSEINGPFFS